MLLFQNIVTVDENFQLLEGQDVLLVDETIAFVGPTNSPDLTALVSARQQSRAQDRVEVVDGEGKLLLPGFFNDHCHVPMTLLRGYGENLPLQAWLKTRIFPFENLLTAEDVYWGSLLGIAEMVSSGVVSFTDMYFLTSAISQAVLESGIKANLCHPLTDDGQAIPFQETNAYQSTQDLLSLSQSLDHDRLIVDIGVHAEYTSTEASVRSLVEFAREKQLRIQVHLSETALEHRECKQRHQGQTPTQYFASCGLWDLPATAAHCVHLEKEDLDILREKGVTLCHNPSSNLKLASGIAPVSHWLADDQRVSLGTDGPASNNNLNMVEEIHLASLLQKGLTLDPTSLNPAEILKIASRNGALSQTRQDSGLICEGYRADLVVFDLDSPGTTPCYDPLANLVYSAQASNLMMTIIDGRVVYKEGAFLTLDLERILFEVRRIAKEKLEILGK